MGTIADAYARAISYLGMVEDPPGSNHCAITERFADLSGWEWCRTGNPWCDMSVSVILSDTGTPTIFAFCPSHVNAFKAGTAGTWLGDHTVDVVQMDVVFFDWNNDGIADHVGFVESDNGDGTLITLEGNSSGPNGDGYYRHTRARSLILGFGRPNYTVAPPVIEQPDQVPQPIQVPQEDDVQNIYFIKQATPDGSAYTADQTVYLSTDDLMTCVALPSYEAYQDLHGWYTGKGMETVYKVWDVRPDPSNNLAFMPMRHMPKIL